MSAKSNINALTVHGRTPLMLACQFGHAAMVEYLLALKDIQTQVCDSEGLSAMVIAADVGGDGGDLMLRMLLLGAADPNVVSRKGKSVLKSCCEQQNIAMVMFLINIPTVARDPAAFELLNEVSPHCAHTPSRIRW